MTNGELPAGWTWTTLGDVAQINRRNPDIQKLPDALPVTFLPMSAVDAEMGTIAKPNIRPLKEVRKGFTSFSDGDVLFAKITPCMENGKAAIARNLQNGIGFGSTEFHVLRPGENVISEWIFQFIRQEEFRREAKAQFAGTAGQLRVPAKFLVDYSFPLPPLPEQQRIVARIEELFTQVEAGTAALKRVQAKLKRYKASVLKAACEGRLVEHRDNNDAITILKESTTPATISKKKAGRLWGSGTVPEITEEIRLSIPSNWIWAKVIDLNNKEDAVQVGPMSMRSIDFEATGIPVLNVGCVKWGEFDESKLDFLPERKSAEFNRYRIKPGDVMFTRSGTVGRSAVVQDHQSGWLMTFHLLRVRTDPSVCLPEYLQIVFDGASHIRKQTRDASIGTTRAGFNTNLLNMLDIPLPPLREQRQIVAEVERLLSTAAKLEQTVTAGLTRAARLRQSILKAAFEGKLV